MASGDNVGTHGQSFFGYCGLGFEASGSYGTAVDPGAFADIISDGFSGDNGTLYLNTIRGRDRFFGNAGAYEDSGSLEMAAAPENGIGYLLKACLGNENLTTEDPNTTGSPVIGHHEFTSADLLPSLTVELGVADIQAAQHVGCAVDTLELEHAAEEYLTSTFEIMAKEPQLQSSMASPSYSDLRPFVYHDGSFSFDGSDKTTDLQEVTFSAENDLETQYRGERTAEFMNVGQRVAEAEGTLDFSSASLWEKFLGSAGATSPEKQLYEGNITASWKTPELIGNTSTKYELAIDMPRVVIDAREASMNEDEQVAEEVTFGALYDPAAGYDIAITLTNGITTTY